MSHQPPSDPAGRRAQVGEVRDGPIPLGERPTDDADAAGFAALLDAYRERLAALADRRRALAREELRVRAAEFDRARALVGTENALTGKPHSWTSACDAAAGDPATFADRHALVEARHALEIAEAEASAARLELLWCVADRGRARIDVGVT